MPNAIISGGSWEQTISYQLEAITPVNGSWLQAIANALANLPAASTTPAEIVYFDTIDPNLSGTTFDPDTQLALNTLYVSNEPTTPGATWTSDGISYATYTPTQSDNTEWNINGTSVDAGSNKTIAIARSGATYIGISTAFTSDVKFGVATSGGTIALRVFENNAFSEGFNTTALGTASHAEGRDARATGLYSHAEGHATLASGSRAHAEGVSTTASGTFGPHAEGNETVASNESAHAEGYRTTASGILSHAEGQSTTASGLDSHSEGLSTIASGTQSHAEGQGSKAIGNVSHSEGQNTTASGATSHAEGQNTTASGQAAHVEGSGGNLASGTSSHAEGQSNIASGTGSHAEGVNTRATGNYSHAEGQGTTAAGTQSHSEGLGSKALGNFSHAEGDSTTASGIASHAGGLSTIASGNYSFVHGTGSTASGLGTVVLGNNITGTSDNTLYANTINSTTISATTYLGLPSGLAYFSESQNTTSPNNTVYVNQLSAYSLSASADFVIKPKGTGAFIVGHIPDGTSTDGNKRGDYAVDINPGALASAVNGATGSRSISIGGGAANGADSITLGRLGYAAATGSVCIGGGLATNGATGAYSAILGGNDNKASTASGVGSTSLGGADATGNYSTAAGIGAIASGIGSVALGGAYVSWAQASANYSFATNNSTLANGLYSSAFGIYTSSKGIASRLSIGSFQDIAPYLQGNSQTSIGAVTIQTTTSASTSLLVYNGTVIALPLQNNELIRVKGSIVGKQTASTNACVYDFDCVIVRNTTAASTVIHNSNMTLVFDNITVGTIPSLTADTTNGGLDIKSGGKDATTIKWVASIYSTESILA